MLQDAGYEVVATVDSLRRRGRGDRGASALDLVLTDISLAGDGDGTDVARRGRARRASRCCSSPAIAPRRREALALGCLAKPYSERMLLAALRGGRRASAGRTATLDSELCRERS